jgi:hopanoid biosynthesis associated RND transporter like protein HpnN
LRTLIARVAAASSERAWLVVCIAGVLCLVAAYYVGRHIAIDTDTTRLLSDKLPWRQQEKIFDAAFPHRTDLIAIVVDGATPELAEQATAALTQRLSSDRAAFRAVWRPDGGQFFDRAGLLFESTEEVAQTMEQLVAAQPLLGPLAADPTLRGLMRALTPVLDGVAQGQVSIEALRKPLGVLADALDEITAGRMPVFSWQRLITGRAPSGREVRRFILVQPVLDYGALEPGAHASGVIRRAAHELAFDGAPRVHVRLTGPVPLADEEFSTLADGAARNATLTLVAVVALLAWALRSWRLVAAVLACLAVGLIVTAAWGLALFGAFNLISVAFAVLFVGLSVDFGIQFCVGFRARRFAGDDLHAALREAARDVGVSLALASVATAAAFFSFLPTPYRGVSELGVIAGAGMIAAFTISVTLLPALIALLRPRGEQTAGGYAILAPVDRFVARRGRWILGASAALGVASLVFLPGLEFDFNPLHLRSPNVESVATLLDLMRDPDSTPDTIDVLAPSLGDATVLAAQLSELPEVSHALTLASFVPERQSEKLALIADAALLLDPVLNPAPPGPGPSDDETIHAIDDALRAAKRAEPVGPSAELRRLAQALQALARGDRALRERAREALIPGLQLTLLQLRAAMQAESVSLDTLPPTLIRDWVAPDGRARIEVHPKAGPDDNAVLRRFVEAVRRVAPGASGAPVSIQEYGRTIVRSFIEAGAWALLSIVVILIITLRRTVDVLLTLAPLLLAGLMTLGLCVALELPLNFANIIALPLLFGIGVAFDIYYVMAWRAGRRDFLQSTLTRAVVFSALTTGTAFGSLWWSHHPGTSSMGALLALSLACTLVSTLVFLPALLNAVPARR